MPKATSGPLASKKVRARTKHKAIQHSGEFAGETIVKITIGGEDTSHIKQVA